MTPPELEPGEQAPIAVAPDSLGRALKKLLHRGPRSGRSIKVATLAEKLGISPSSVYAYLSGETLPSPERLDDLLTKLEIPAADARWYHELRESTDARFPARTRPGIIDFGPPLIEIRLPDGTAEVATVEDGRGMPAAEQNLAGPYVIEELADHVYVDVRRTIPRVDCRRRIRATSADVRRFSYSFEHSPESGLRQVVVESHAGAVVSQVIRVGRNSYLFHFDLPEPLGHGQTGEIAFSLLTVENQNDDPQGIYGKRQLVETERLNLTVEFAGNVVPTRMSWFAPAFPVGNFPDGFDFPVEQIVERDSEGRYQRTFSRTDLPEGRIVGMMWEY